MAVILFEEIQFGFLGHSANWPIESGLVPAQLADKIQINNNQVILAEYDSKIDANINAPIINWLTF